MRVVILSLALLYCISVSAQNTEGIKFEKGLSWAQLKQKAKKENKYIFLDCFTTSCAPCKLMDKNVFTTQAAGDFFNANFINIKLQFDQTNSDNEEVKSWYKDANEFKTAYGIEVFPTYLFFDSNGIVVHKLSGSELVVDKFIAKSKVALDPKSQFYTLKLQFDAGRKDARFLRSLLRAAEFVGEKETYCSIANRYLSVQKDLLTEDNLRLIAGSTMKTSDVGFEVLRQHSAKADHYLGTGISASMVRGLIIDELIVPMLRNGGTVKRNGGMEIFTGSPNENVQWDTLRTSIAVYYPELADELTLASKIMYYQWKEDWRTFGKSLSAFVAGYSNRISSDKLSEYAWAVLNAPSETGCVETMASRMGKVAVESGGNAGHCYCEAMLLYKANKKEDAIAKMNQLIAKENDASGQLSSLLAKMNKGEKIY